VLDRRELPRPLRILLAGAEPRSLRLLSLDEEIERVCKAVERPGEIEVQSLAHTTPESLRRALTEGKEFHVLHFMGHGDFDPTSGEGEILFEDGRRGTSNVPGCWLADQLRDRISLRLVFLNTCRTARSVAPSPFGGVATALVQAGVPAVLAMQFPIADSAAIVFSETVYRCLAAGDPIDAAVTEGRHAMAARTPKLLAWGTPVLFSHVPDGRLFISGRPKPSKTTTVPPPSTASALRPLHQLPAPPADFVGREPELAELRAAMATGGFTICGLLGMGGVGKTALALKLAHEFRRAFPDGQIYLDLRGMSENPIAPDEAAAHVIRSFHPETPLPEAPQLAALYREVLHDKRVLLLMDNAADREQVEPLLPPDTCALLVTSRQRFSLPGLFRRDLDQLPAEDACALLRKISPRIGDQDATLAHLCGFLPFALRLAASTLAERTDLKVADYLHRLEQEGQKAKLGEAALGVSYALLPEALQERFRALAVFPVGFDAPAAAAVWNLTGKEEETDEALGELVRRSLLEGEEGRYRLHDLTRAYARFSFTYEEEEAARARHAHHFVTVLSAATELYLQGNEHILSGLSIFDRERSNILAGQAWAVERADVSDDAARVANQFPYSGAHLLKLRLSPHEQIAWVEPGLAGARKLGDRLLEGAHLGGLGIAYAALGETHQAIEHFEHYLAIARETGDRRGEGNALGNLGNAYADLGETRRAIDLHAQDLAIRREIGDRRGEGNALGNLGTAYADLGETRQAIELYEQRLEIAREIGDRRGEANASWNLGAAYEKLGEIARAVNCMQACVDFEREVGLPDAEKDAAHVEELRAQACPPYPRFFS
jgi:tetratricopeptide (TPR) repeat protein